MPRVERQESMKHEQLSVEPKQDQEDLPLENMGPNSDEQGRIKSQDLNESVQLATQKLGQCYHSYLPYMPARDLWTQQIVVDKFLLLHSINKSTSYCDRTTRILTKLSSRNWAIIAACNCTIQYPHSLLLLQSHQILGITIWAILSTDFLQCCLSI